MRLSLFTFSVLLCIQASAATFGTRVIIGGHASDLALDESRGRLYIANFAGRRIDVMSTSDNTLRTPIPLAGAGDTGSIALSPDSRYLAAANYDSCAGCAFLTGSSAPLCTVMDLGGEGGPQPNRFRAQSRRDHG